MIVLISGGSGLIGKAISKQLLQKGHEVRFLSRNPESRKDKIVEFGWDPDTGEMDISSLENVDVIINLAGAPLNKRWTPEYKNEILRSRVDSTRLLYNEVAKNSIPLKAFVSASAAGYYPNDLEKEYTEKDAPGNDFLSLVCQKWEQEAQNFENLNIRTVRCRIGLVLSYEGGALPEFVKPIRFGLGAPLGSGKQWMPWIHIEDLAGIFVHAVENENLKGVFNAGGPYNITNKQLNEAIAEVLEKPLILPKVPAVILKTVLGEMAEVVLASTRMSTEKIQESGYSYNFSDLKKALSDLLK